LAIGEMRRDVIFAVAAWLLLGVRLSYLEAWTHGNTTAAITYNILTYTSCNGTGNDSTGFANWLADANTWQSTHSGLIELDIPNGAVCMFTNMSGAQNVGAGLKQLRIVGYGATFSDNAGAGAGFFLGGGPVAGVQFNGTTSTVRLATVAAGASAITVLDTSKCGLWSAGDWALVAGIDPQGDGDPPNPQIFEYVQIASTASCAGSGAIGLTAALKNGYKSTWPLYNSGTAFVSDKGGPATLYALGQNWVTTQEYRGLTLDQDRQTMSIGQNITYRDVTFTGSICGIPSQNGTWSVIGGSMTNCNMEVDKIIDTMSFTNTTIHLIDFQSASVNNVNLSGTTVTLSMNGSAGTLTTISNSSNLTNFTPGAHSFGRSGEVRISNSVISALTDAGAATQSDINLRGTWALGKLSVPNNTNVISAADNGSGLIRVLVDSTTGYSTGFATTIGGLGADPCKGDWIVTVDGPTHFVLQNSMFTATCTGVLGSLPLNWAVPGANIYWGNRFKTQGPVAQITDLTQDVNGTYVQTTLPGAFPAMPLDGGVARVRVHSAPKFTCTNCTGSADAVDLSQAGSAGVPLWSYSKRSFNSASPVVAIPVWGQLVSLQYTMPTPYTGASALLFGGIGFITTLNSVTVTDYEPWINAAVAGTRTIFPTSATGAQSGDGLTTPGSGAWFVNNQNLACYFVIDITHPCSTPADMAGTTATMEIIANQGVVYP
jgi:hypothetical protein